MRNQAIVNSELFYPYLTLTNNIDKQQGYNDLLYYTTALLENVLCY